ncbi:hypothetical protein NDU88_003372 [Pleurodeles waltl]|uniref:Uncharacterized protein n=1 Tax=Pleurodeles waltl TaxID=8319 RepID=A0AAV7LF56_PLEWA|nr:hypothetical protein NDU88_003372 [Pleurodeles waltl]
MITAPAIGAQWAEEIPRTRAPTGPTVGDSLLRTLSEHKYRTCTLGQHLPVPPQESPEMNLEVEESRTFKEEGEEGSCGLPTTDGSDGDGGKEKTPDLREQRNQQCDGGPEKQWNDQEVKRHFNQLRSGESVALSAGESNPDGQILRSNQDLEVEEGGAFKQKGEKGSCGLPTTDGSDRDGGKEKTLDPRERRNQQHDSGPEKEWNDQEAKRHYNRPRSGDSVASSGMVLQAGHG